MTKFLVIALTCVGIGLAAWWGLTIFNKIQGVQISTNGMIAAGLGVFFSLVVGFGLMALLFFSSRHGHDDAVHNLHNETDHQDQI